MHVTVRTFKVRRRQQQQQRRERGQKYAMQEEATQVQVESWTNKVHFILPLILSHTVIGNAYNFMWFGYANIKSRKTNKNEREKNGKNYIFALVKTVIVPSMWLASLGKDESQSSTIYSHAHSFPFPHMILFSVHKHTSIKSFKRLLSIWLSSLSLFSFISVTRDAPTS